MHLSIIAFVKMAGLSTFAPHMSTLQKAILDQAVAAVEEESRRESHEDSMRHTITDVQTMDGVGAESVV